MEEVKKRGRPRKEDSSKKAALVPKKRQSNGRNSPVIGNNGILIKNDEFRALTSRLLNETIATYEMPRVKSDEELAQRISDYFYHCAETGEKPTVEQMAQCTGYSIGTVWDWENGINHGFSSDTSEIIKKAKGFLRVFDAKLVTEGALNPVTYIFRAKNYYGMKDTQDVVLTPNNPLGAETTPQALTEKYKEALPESTEK